MLVKGVQEWATTRSYLLMNFNHQWTQYQESFVIIKSTRMYELFLCMDTYIDTIKRYTTPNNNAVVALRGLVCIHVFIYLYRVREIK